MQKEILQSPWLWLGAQCSAGTQPSPHLLQARGPMGFCLQGVSDLESASGLCVYTNIETNAASKLCPEMLFLLASSYRGSKGAHDFLHIILRFSGKGVTPAFCLELLLCCESVGTGGVLCTVLCRPRVTDLVEVCAEVHFGA